MHETSLARKIIEEVVKVAGEKASRVRRVRVAVRPPAMVMAEALREGFDLLKRESLLAGAVLEISEGEMVFFCRDCRRESSGKKMISSCPHCGSEALRLARQGEVYIESIDFAP
ncbi:MAG: hydrogenase maturation nickel metallochaperone HypA/HybF [Bacillota bacterium]